MRFSSMSEEAVALVELGVRQRRVVAERGQAIRHPDVGDVDRSHLSSSDFGVVGPTHATRQAARMIRLRLRQRSGRTVC
jgi:hypothetical protein